MDFLRCEDSFGDWESRGIGRVLHWILEGRSVGRSNNADPIVPKLRSNMCT